MKFLNMLNIDDEDISVNYKKASVSGTISIFDQIPVGAPIYYDAQQKIFKYGNGGTDNALVGYFMHHNKRTDMICVLFKNFLKKNCLSVPLSLGDAFVQTYIIKSFYQYRDAIIANMPRIKKLKRIKLQMINKTVALLMHDNLNEIINSYAQAFGEEEAKCLKASIVTTPIYIQDRGVVKLYDFSANELKIPDVESAGNFLAFFLFKDPYI